jgi:uncharacterized membrane protein YcaP (DUF421 family)
MDWIVLLKIVLIYVLILIVMKFMGKREIGQLSLFDFVVLLIIADIAAIGIEAKDDPFYIYIIGICLLALIQKLLAIFSLRLPKLRNFLDGEKSLIVIDGKINLKEMKKQSYNIDDLIIQLRLKNIRSLSEVRYVILEANGEISVFKFSDFESQGSDSNNADYNTAKPNNNSSKQTSSNKGNNNQQGNSGGNEIYPFPLIVSGEIVKKNAQLLKISEEWLKEEVKKQGYKDIKDVFYANLENGKLFIVQTCDF